MCELGNCDLGQRLIWRQGRISRTNNRQAAHTRSNSSLDFVDVVAQEQPSIEVLMLRVMRDDLRVAVDLGLGARVGCIKVVGDKGGHIWLLGVCVCEEQFLRRDRAGRIDDDLLSLLGGLVEERLDIWEERGNNVARLVALQPEISLERLKVGYLNITLHKVANVCFEVRRRVAVLFGESITILCKLWTVPLLFQDFGKCLECIWELGTANRPWSAGCSVVDVGYTITKRDKVGEVVKGAGEDVLVSKKTQLHTPETCATWHDLVRQLGRREVDVKAGG